MRSQSNISDRNSEAAQAYAAKKKEQLARANAMRMQRERIDRDTELAGPGFRNVGSAALVPNTNYQRSEFGVGNFEVESHSYGTTTERLIIRPSGVRSGEERKMSLGYSDLTGTGPSAPLAYRHAEVERKRATSFQKSNLEPPTDDIITDTEIMNGAKISCARSHHAYRVGSESFVVPPSDPSGVQVDLSDQPILCLSSNSRDEVVFGCADHALYAVNIDSLLGGKPSRPKTMYSKQYGHTDWVTSVAHLADGRVLSAAMDSKLCLWDRSRTRCVDLTSGHTKSVAKVVADMRYNVAMSCGYDGQVALWSFGESAGSSTISSSAAAGSSSRRIGAAAAPLRRTSASSAAVTVPAAILSGHGDPVLECTYNGSVCATGARNGGLIFWDLNTCEAISRIRAHRGSVTAIEPLPGNSCFLTAGVDGLVKLWDPREKTSSLTIPAHAGEVLRGPAIGAAAAAAASQVSSAGSRGSGGVRGGQQGRGRGGSTSSSVTKASGGGAGGAGGGGEIAAAAVACMCVLRRDGGGEASLVVTGGADSDVCVLDVRMDFAVVHRWQHHKLGLYSMCALGDSCVMTGDGAGMLLAYDCVGISGDPGVKYGLGASGQGAVRGITSIGNGVIAAGEDGKVLSYLFG